MPQNDKNSMWIEGVEPTPPAPAAKAAPKKAAPKSTPFEEEFGAPMKRMPPIPNLGKSLSKRLSKA
jgi:hypothetical protein